MIIIDKSNHIFSMNKDNLPAQFCKSGDIVTFETLDCFCNNFISSSTVFGRDNPKEINPATGPLYIEGCEVGDTLKIEILDIELGDVGIVITGPVNKIFNQYLKRFNINRLKVEDGSIHISDDLKVSVSPMIGVIGVAPAEKIPTALLGNHGGNLDCNDIAKGTILYLPAFVEGGLLAIGDLHAIMGDGEIGECGLEIEGRVTVKVSVIKQMIITGPMLESDDFVEMIECGETLEEASVKASQRMLKYMIEVLKINKEEAALLLNLCGNIKICQQVNVIKSVAMKMPKNCLMSKI